MFSQIEFYSLFLSFSEFHLLVTFLSIQFRVQASFERFTWFVRFTILQNVHVCINFMIIWHYYGDSVAAICHTDYEHYLF